MDLDAEENASVNRKVSLEKDEVIEPLLVSLDVFPTSVQSRVEEKRPPVDLFNQGYGIELLVYYFALGLRLKERYCVSWHCLFGDESSGSFLTETVTEQRTADDQCVIGSGWM